jgi:hypothetical protein
MLGPFGSKFLSPCWSWAVLLVSHNFVPSRVEIILFLLMLRPIWIERNDMIFRNKLKTEDQLLDTIGEEPNSWKLEGFL